MTMAGNQRRIARGNRTRSWNGLRYMETDERISFRQPKQSHAINMNDVLTIIGMMAVVVAVGTLWITGRI